jgi:hypothetical protein
MPSGVIFRPAASFLFGKKLRLKAIYLILVGAAITAWIFIVSLTAIKIFEMI